MTTPAAPPRRRSTRWVPAVVAVLAAGAVTGWVLGDVLGPGVYLVRDFVAVPDPVRPPGLLPDTAADLRAWPLDAVTWALAGLVAPGTQQAALVVGALLLAGVGAGLLVARAGPAAVAAAAVLAVWNPYVTERLLLGQPPTLLAYAAMPWVLLAARSGRGTGTRTALLALSLAPAALTPWGGLLGLATAVVGAASRRGRSVRDVALAGALGLAWCLPWLVPALVAGGVDADPDGAAAFALADDTGWGTWVSAVTGGGVWGSGAVPLSRSDPLALGASGALVGLAVGGAGVLARVRGWRPAWAALAALLLPATVLTVLSGPLLPLVSDAQAVPGVALLRDQHRLLAPAVLAGACLVGLAVGGVARAGGRLAGGVTAALALALAVASVPDLPREVRTAYRPVTYPAGWAEVVAAVEARPGRPVVASLPWQPLRRPEWAGPTPFLDPLPRAVDARVLADTDLTVRRDGSTVVVTEGSGAADPGWATGQVSAASLRVREVTLVVEWLGTPGDLPADRDGWDLVVATTDFRVWDVTAAR